MCNSCGDKFTANELGPLVAPGAAHPDQDPAAQNSAKGEERAMPDRPILPADAATDGAETDSLNPISADTEPVLEPASHATDTLTGSPTPLTAEGSANPVAPTPTTMDIEPVASGDAPGSLKSAHAQAAVPFTSSTNQQDLNLHSTAPATPMNPDHSADRPSTGGPETT